MLKKILSFLIFFLITTYSSAQSDFREGFIIKNNYDTIYGLIDYRGDMLMSQVCRFKIKEGEEKKFDPEEIFGYRFIDDKFFVSKEVNGTKYFLECLINGEVNVYYLRDLSGDHYYLEKEGIGLKELPYDEKVKTLYDKRYNYKSIKHVGVLIYYMQDSPELMARINNFKKPEHAALIKIARDYHENKCNDDSCIIYSKMKPKFKFVVEFAAGVVNYRHDLVNNNSSLLSGVLTHIWLPRTNEKLFFRTGILYSNIDYIKRYSNSKERTQFSYLKIPLHLEYIYPKGFLQPKLSYGLNLYTLFGGDFFTTNSFNGGANIKVSKSIHLSLNYEMDFKPKNFIFIPNTKLSNSMSAGLLFRL